MRINIKYIVLIAFSLMEMSLLAQTKEKCAQFRSVIAYLETDSAANATFNVRNVRYRINPKVSQNKGIPFLITEYYAEVTGLSEEQLKSDTAVLYPVFRENQKRLLQTDTTIMLTCLKGLNSNRPNVSMKFSRLDAFSITVTTGKISKRKREPAYGKYYIFFFDRENRIRKVLQTDWIE